MTDKLLIVACWSFASPSIYNKKIQLKKLMLNCWKKNTSKSNRKYIGDIAINIGVACCSALCHIRNLM